jgi:hypothetical protein
MRIFQNIHLYPQQVDIVDLTVGREAGFATRINTIISEGLNGPHLLAPVAQRDTDAFLSCTADVVGQRAWAMHKGMKATSHPHEVLAAQLEEFKPDVFYTHGAGYFPSAVLRRLRGLARVNISWKAPPDFTGSGLEGFDMIVNNFASSFPKYQALAKIKTGFLTPSFDSAMEPECYDKERPIDVVFVGSYSRHHRNRAAVLEKLLELDESHKIQLSLSYDRLTKLADSWFGVLPPLARHRPSRRIRSLRVPPLFGRSMYRLFSKAKIVVNSAIDVAGQDRGNIRCFEAMGCGALLVSDAGIYPPGFDPSQNFSTYTSLNNLLDVLRRHLQDPVETLRIAGCGQALATGAYGKDSVWRQFQELVAQI